MLNIIGNRAVTYIGTISNNQKKIIKNDNAKAFQNNELPPVIVTTNPNRIRPVNKLNFLII